ncbi:MAG: helix-turn-helix domain-containing protein [Turneriella sp.]
MAEPPHLSIEILHRLMRLFMEHKTDVLPVVERGRIVGQLDRLALVEALSEIRPEGYTLTVQEAESADELLRRLDQEGASGLATINRNFEFNAVWGRAEILQAQGKIPQVKIWQPPTKDGVGLTEPRRTATDAAEAAVAEQAATHQPVIAPAAREIRLAEIPQLVKSAVKPAQAESPLASPPEAAATISIVRELPAAPAAAPKIETRPIAENLHREIENGRMAINTLAALDIPLLACHGSGSEIFHNRAFQDIRLRDAMHLKTEDLVARAKDAIAESALKGDLDIDKAVRLGQAPRGYECYCKAIRDYENPTSRAFGYIFWLVPAAPAASEATALYSATEGSAEFTGKTLPDILAAEEARAMAWAMAEANGNQSDAALLLGIPRQTFNYRFRKLTRARMTGNRQIKDAARQRNGKPPVGNADGANEAGKA